MYWKQCLPIVQRFSYVFPPPISHKEPELSSSDSITGARCSYHSPVACNLEIKTWTIRGITHLYALTLTCDILDPPVWNFLFWKTSQMENKTVRRVCAGGQWDSSNNIVFMVQGFLLQILEVGECAKKQVWKQILEDIITSDARHTDKQRNKEIGLPFVIHFLPLSLIRRSHRKIKTTSKVLAAVHSHRVFTGLTVSLTHKQPVCIVTRHMYTG